MRSLAGRIGASMISIGLLTSVAARPPRPWQPISDERRSHLTGPVLDRGPREADAGTHCQGNKAAEGVTFESRIYGVAQPELLKYLRGLPETVECAVMIGHNPGLHDLALALADTKSRKRLPPAEGKFPTGAMAAFRFDGAWKELRSNAATVLSFTSPKEIVARLRPHSP